MINKYVFHILPVVTVAAVMLLGSALAQADIEEVDKYVEKADDLVEHADVVVEASDAVIEAVDSMVEEVDAMVEDAGEALESPVEQAFANEAMEHADELLEAADLANEANLVVLTEVYDLLLDADDKIEMAIDDFPGRPGPWTGTKGGVLRKAYAALESADEAIEAALFAVCPYDADEAPPAPQDPCTDIDIDLEQDGALGKLRVAEEKIHDADDAIHGSLEVGSPGDEDVTSAEIFEEDGVDDAVHAADLAVEAADAAIEAADAAIEAADKAVERADRLVEAAG